MSLRLDMVEARRLLAGALPYSKAGTVRARRLTEPRSWTTENGDAMHGQAGDWLVEDDDDRWTVEAAVFAGRYKEVAPGTYRADQVVRAVLVEEPVEVETLEGWASADAGDALLMGPDGDVWPVPKARFTKSYRRVVAGV